MDDPFASIIRYHVSKHDRLFYAYILKNNIANIYMTNSPFIYSENIWLDREVYTEIKIISI